MRDPSSGPRLLEQAKLRLVGLGDGHRIAAAEAGRAMTAARGVVRRRQQPFVREVGEAVGPDEAADLLDLVRRRDQLALERRGGAVVAGAGGRGGGGGRGAGG